MKSHQPLWRVCVATSAEAEDAVGELLGAVLDLPVAAYFDLESQTSHVSVFVEPGKFRPLAARREIAAGLERIQGFGLETAPAKIGITRIKREDWAESWKRHFHPLTIKPSGNSPAPALLLKPSWSRKLPAKNQIVLVLDPGLSFGTGHHPTTSFCLQQIVDCHKPATKQSFWDVGTGSGILAIAAAKLGYAPVEAFDFDPDAVRVARENARKNKVDKRLRLARGDITRLPLRPARQFDLICANLISTLLIAERRRIVHRLKPGGTLVLAGILAKEFVEVERAYADSKLRLCSRRVENEWCSGAFCLA
jgi:ribosomal protein L11 methyltransferase